MAITYAKPSARDVDAAVRAAGINQLRTWEAAWRTLSNGLRTAGDVAQAEAAEGAAAWFGNLATLAEVHQV